MEHHFSGASSRLVPTSMMNKSWASKTSASAMETKKARHRRENELCKCWSEIRNQDLKRNTHPQRFQTTLILVKTLSIKLQLVCLAFGIVKRFVLILGHCERGRRSPSEGRVQMNEKT